MDVSNNLCEGERKFFFKMKEGCKSSWVKIIACSIVVKEGTNTLSFHNFGYGAECSAEPGAK